MGSSSAGHCSDARQFRTTGRVADVRARAAGEAWAVAAAAVGLVAGLAAFGPVSAVIRSWMRAMASPSFDSADLALALAVLAVLLRERAGSLLAAVL